MWAGIKHAINSTLGTDEFKPLDKLIDDSIKGTRTLAASDAVLKVLHGGSEVEEFTKTFTVNTTGSIRIKVSGRMSNNTYAFRVFITLETTSGVVVASQIISDPTNTGTVTIDVPISKDAYTLNIERDVASNQIRPKISNVSICAIVTDTELITVNS